MAKEDVFVVHGRDIATKNAMVTFIRSIGLRPIEWTQAVRSAGKGAPYVGEVLDAGFEEAQAVVVLLTGDDEARLREKHLTEGDPSFEAELTPQVRPNVLIEAGMALHKDADRTIFVKFGDDLRPASDIAGRHVIMFDGSPENRQDLANRLQTAGCPVDRSGEDWLSAGDFSTLTTSVLAEDNVDQVDNTLTLDLEHDELNILAQIGHSAEEGRSAGSLAQSQRLNQPRVEHFLRSLIQRGLIDHKEIGDMYAPVYVATHEGIKLLVNEDMI